MKNRYDAEKTIDDILDVSTALFIEKGFEKTSIQDIVRGLDGLTRGAIYHHFESKDAIINAVMRRLLPTDRFLEKVAKREDITGMEKIQCVVEEAIFNTDYQERMVDASKLFHDPKFFVEYTKVNVLDFSPYIEGFIIEGNRDGSFDIPYPKHIAEVMMLLMSTWFVSGIFPSSDKDAVDKLLALQYLFRSIGVELFGKKIQGIIGELVKLQEEVEK